MPNTNSKAFSDSVDGLTTKRGLTQLVAVVTESEERIIEGYATAAQSRRLCDSCLTFLHAGSRLNRWGTSLLRLKYGLDASEYAPVQATFRHRAAEVASKWRWREPELVSFLAEFVLDAWLLDRRLFVSIDLKQMSRVLRNVLKKEEEETAAGLIYHVRQTGVKPEWERSFQFSRERFYEQFCK